jgi:plastocyanin
MNTMRSTVIIVLLFAAAAFIGGYLWRGDRRATPEPSPTASVYVAPGTATTPTVVPARQPKVHTVRYTASGVTPEKITVFAGDAVTFVNGTSTAVWPASDPHLTHSGCPEFDARRGLRNGEEYTLIFDSAKTCTYHDHLDPTNDTHRGTITVR